MNTTPPRQPPEYRQDPVTGNWVILAPERAYRPIGLGLPTIPTGEADCPFCEGREEQTPPEILAVRPSTSATPSAVDATRANRPGWTIRIVPNGFPALRTNALAAEGEATILGQPGYGTHDVVVECPEHCDGLSHVSAVHFEALARAYRDRLRQLSGDSRLAAVLLFKNRGALAGASLFHAHSQILGLDRVPPLLERELSGCDRHFSTTGRCLFCDLLAQELAAGTRILLETEDFVAWCPHASRFPLEAWLVPRRHEAHFHRIDDPEANSFGRTLQQLLATLESLLPIPSYNFFLHTYPFHRGRLSGYHWHLEITPRLLGLAGFEMGTGMFINPVPPEWAAQRWREVPNRLS